MGKIDIKWCRECDCFQEVEWGVDNEIPNEPRFFITCRTCGVQQEAEPPVHFESKELPEGQTTL